MLPYTFLVINHSMAYLSIRPDNLSWHWRLWRRRWSVHHKILNTWTFHLHSTNLSKFSSTLCYMATSLTSSILSLTECTKNTINEYKFTRNGRVRKGRCLGCFRLTNILQSPSFRISIFSHVPFKRHKTALKIAVWILIRMT